MRPARYVGEIHLDAEGEIPAKDFPVFHVTRPGQLEVRFPGIVSGRTTPATGLFFMATFPWGMVFAPLRDWTPASLLHADRRVAAIAIARMDASARARLLAEIASLRTTTEAVQ